MCSKPGCGQLFNNDDDRQRHEMRDKKHVATYTPESTASRPGIEPLLGCGLSIPRISVESPTNPHSQAMQWDQGYVNICFICVSWFTEVHSSYHEASPFMQGYHSASGPQEIPIFDTLSDTFSGLPASPGGIGKGSLASSESCFSNPSSPANQDDGEFFQQHDSAVCLLVFCSSNVVWQTSTVHQTMTEISANRLAMSSSTWMNT